MQATCLGGVQDFAVVNGSTVPSYDKNVVQFFHSLRPTMTLHATPSVIVEKKRFAGFLIIGADRPRDEWVLGINEKGMALWASKNLVLY